MKNIHSNFLKVLLLLSFISYSKIYSQQDAENVAKALSNPVASLYSVPFQNNFQLGIGPEKGYKYLLNFQPVIPVSLSKSINLINRAIFPVIFQNHVIGTSRQNGLGDILYSAFLSPSKSKIIWGIGPALSFPTATDSMLGTKKLLFGPTIVVLGQPGSWTIGALANNLWSVAGAEYRSEITALYVQPFITYNTKGGMGIGASSENSYDWRRKMLTSGLVALNLSQVFKFDGKQIASLNLSPLYYYSNERVNKPEWGARVTITLVFPKK
ncbi:MAG: hypothetical protein IPL16_18535 [Ignavibacteria bacterium]|nr:hypothetical protein [Ignavibacteria bacterium]